MPSFWRVLTTRERYKCSRSVVVNALVFGGGLTTITLEAIKTSRMRREKGKDVTNKREPNMQCAEVFNTF